MTSNYKYPLLKKILEVYDFKKESLDGIYILACQHILEPQAKMLEILNEYGIPKENMIIFGKIYSTSNEVLNEMSLKDFNVSQAGFNPNISFDTQHLENCEREFNNFVKHIKNPTKIIIMDDGGELLKTVNNNFNLIDKSIPIIGVEQTSSGFRKLENSEIHFPIFNVARSNLKLVKESPIIADLGCRRVLETLEKYKIKEPKILVVGLGPIGNNMNLILKGKGYCVLGYDTAHHDEEDLVELIKSNNINIIIGASGSNILDEAGIDLLIKESRKNIYLISMSSSDREFPAVYLREKSNASSGVHSDVICDQIVLVNNGFPITFKGNSFESTPEEIEKTIALLLGSTFESIEGEFSQNGFIDVQQRAIDIIEKNESN